MALPANGEEMERLPFPAARAILRGCLKMMMMRRRFIFQLRGEFYGFIPIFPIKKDEYGQAYYGKAFTKFEYLGEISLVFQLSFGSISAYVNHYSSPSNDWNVGLTLGWQLFNSRFVE